MKKKVAFYTLGCKLNYSETSTIARQFEKNNFQVVTFTENPDIFVINTCSVTDHADKKCAKVVKEAKKINPLSYVVVVGCYAQLKPKEISEIPGVDAVLGASEKFRIIEILSDFPPKDKAVIFAQSIEDVTNFNPSYSLHERTRTFLKIQDGCDYSCSFCTIPLARGRSRSPYIRDIIHQVYEIKSFGIKEIVLTGVNIGDFGLHDGFRKEKFIDLLRELDKTGISRFRISSIEPNLLTDEIIEFVAQSSSFMPHFHIPLQSGNDKILSLMRRRYRRSLYEERINKIKNLIPHACIGVDVITGFPSETDEQFLDSYQFISNLPVSYLHVFTYSERANTHALKIKGRVPERIRSERTNELRKLSEKKKKSFYKQNIGKIANVLFEKEEHSDYMFGFTENYIKVREKYDPLKVNEIIQVKLAKLDESAEFIEPCEVETDQILIS